MGINSVSASSSAELAKWVTYLYLYLHAPILAMPLTTQLLKVMQHAFRLIYTRSYMLRMYIYEEVKYPHSFFLFIESNFERFSSAFQPCFRSLFFLHEIKIQLWPLFVC